ncbi:MAG: biotin/lipoyl-binding protein [Sandaracinaceae bacterium]|nr:biotin/lipoyl-binding protein [Sandaracinaceae bacterium]
MLRKIRARWAVIHLIFPLVFAACADEPVQESVARIQGGPPVIRDVDVTLRYPVELVAAEQVSVAPVAVSGFLTNVFVDVGDKVEAGQVLATLDCR